MIKLSIPRCTDFSSYWSGEMSKALPLSWDVVNCSLSWGKAQESVKLGPSYIGLALLLASSKTLKRGLKGPLLPGLYLLRRAKSSPDTFLFIQSHIYAGSLHLVMPFLKTWLPRLLQGRGRWGRTPAPSSYDRASHMVPTHLEETLSNGVYSENSILAKREIQTFVRMEERSKCRGWQK